MLRILFWNVNRKDLTKQVCELATDTQADIVVLLECEVDRSKTLAELSQVDGNFSLPRDAVNHKRFDCFCRQPNFHLTEVHNTNRTQYHKLHFGDDELLLGLIHGVDIRNYDASHRQSEGIEVANDLRVVCELQDIQRVILLGDFNMNPYDPAMLLPRGINAMMTKAIASTGQRIYQNESFDYFYNPMWGLLGDRGDSPGGTVYNSSSYLGHYGWNMIDQVIIHHSLIDQFESVRILSQTSSTNLLSTRGLPNKKEFSDHLPVLLTMKDLMQ